MFSVGASRGRFRKTKYFNILKTEMSLRTILCPSNNFNIVSDNDLDYGNICDHASFLVIVFQLVLITEISVPEMCTSLQIFLFRKNVSFIQVYVFFSDTIPKS